MLRVLNSLAARVDPAAHPLLDERKAPRASGRALLFVITADRGLCGSFNTNVIKAAAHVHRRAAAIARSRSAWSAGAAATTSRRRGFEVRYEQVNLFAEADASTTRRRSRRRRSRRSSAAQVDASTSSTTSSSRSCRSGSSSSSCCRFRARTIEAPARARRPRRRPVGLSVRAGAGGAVRRAAAAPRRGAGLSRAARVERRVLRRADDRDGRGDAELGRDDRRA